ncbi:galectin-4-like [Octopus sinensis]|uniref:Galectin n=1 Tax=Octopus sinensis TaxID=2607531 RepID=A0A6P7SY80_9MOLL|nr:galectin-4-like [Octopus sinensis]
MELYLYCFGLLFIVYDVYSLKCDQHADEIGCIQERIRRNSLVIGEYMKSEAPTYPVMMDAYLPPGKNRRVTYLGRFVNPCTRVAFNMMNNISVTYSDVALHFDIRFHGSHSYNRKKVLYATRVKGFWNGGNISSRFPFTCGEQFNITIQEELDRYKIYTNGHHYTDYKLSPAILEKVTIIAVWGKVLLTTIEINKHQQEPYVPGNVTEPEVKQLIEKEMSVCVRDAWQS